MPFHRRKQPKSAYATILEKGLAYGGFAMTRTRIKGAVEVWIAAAALQRAHSQRSSFSEAEILAEAGRLNLTVANSTPIPAHFRMLYRLPDKTLRICETAPDRRLVPPEHLALLGWHHERPWIERIRGLGKHIWADTTADEWVAELRKG
jgi:hypothetical protein